MFTVEATGLLCRSVGDEVKLVFHLVKLLAVDDGSSGIRSLERLLHADVGLPLPWADLERIYKRAGH
jgi:hypothetical protein